VKLFAGLDDRYRPLALFATRLASVLVIVSGFVAKGWQWGALGLAVGVPSLVLPFVAQRLRWSVGRTWMLLGFILVLDLGVLSAIASTPGT